MICRILWILTAGLVVAALFGGEISFEGSTASVIDASRTPITFGSMIAGWGATIAGWTGYRSAVPWFNTGKENTWSERQVRRASDHIAAGDTEVERLRRTLALTLVIAALGMLFYAEDSFRNFGLLDAARFGSR